MQRTRSTAAADKETHLEELVTRLDRVSNCVQGTAEYDSFQCLPNWARDFGFGISFEEAFYLDIEDESELEVTLEVTLPDFGLSGQLAFVGRGP